MSTVLLTALAISGIWSLGVGLIGVVVALLEILRQMIFGVGTFEDTTTDDPYSIKHWED